MSPICFSWKSSYFIPQAATTSTRAPLRRECTLPFIFFAQEAPDVNQKSRIAWTSPGRRIVPRHLLAVAHGMDIGLTSSGRRASVRHPLYIGHDPNVASISDFAWIPDVAQTSPMHRTSQRDIAWTSPRHRPDSGHRPDIAQTSGIALAPPEHKTSA